MFETQWWRGRSAGTIGARGYVALLPVVALIVAIGELAILFGHNVRH